MSALGDKIVIFGCGGHSRSVLDVVLSLNPGISVVLVDDNARHGETIFGFPVLREYAAQGHDVFVAIGDNVQRMRKFDSLSAAPPVSVISGSAHRGFGSTVGAGSFLGNFCHLGPEAAVGANTILNTACVVEHEVRIGAHCHIAPHATVSGRCRIGDLVFVGAGATVKESVSICSNVVVGAGATVVKDLTEAGVYVGCPARRIR